IVGGADVVLRPTNISNVDALAVEQHLDLIHVLETSNLAEGRLLQLDLDGVVPGTRKGVLRHHPALRAEGKALAVLRLRHVGRRPVDVSGRSRLWISPGERTDLSCRRQGALAQRRRP